MAGDWIKMRTNLWDDPRVARLCDLTDQGEAAVIGGLYWLWAMADEHTEDGILPGLTLRAIDRKTGVQGLGAALCDIGWLADPPEGVRIVGFEEHNGASAKKRSVTAKRVANHRGNADVTQPQSEDEHDVTQQALQDEHASVTGALAREEKRREEENTTTSLRSVVVLAAQGAPATPAAKAIRGTRLPQDWFLPKAWGEWALKDTPHWTVDIVRLESEKFRDHWHAKSGKDATKNDWEAAWRNWCRSDIAQRAHAPPSASSETAYQRSMRERVEQAAGSMAHVVAAKAPGQRKPQPWDTKHDQHTIEADPTSALVIGMG